MKKVILITGAAGFIGSNLAKNILQKDSEVQVIGVDNLNDYYDVSLKEYRLERTGKNGSIFPFIREISQNAVFWNRSLKNTNRKLL